MRFLPSTSASTCRRQLTLSILAATLCWTCSQQSAEASCGDYVMLGDHHPAHSSMPSTPAGPHHCRGPGCRQIPFAPLAPEKVVVGDETDWGLPDAFLLDAAPPAAHWLRDRDFARARLCPLGVFRPPRFAA
ncbi:MAG TPA: hypothetical protein VHB77_01530 [Planctomycetaceae bacterium]|nr:hypothetical protein [Planctomycetaceae bacterium]